MDVFSGWAADLSHLTISLTWPAVGAIAADMADEAPKPQRPLKPRDERERRYDLIADALEDGRDFDRIAQTLGISRRQLTPMLGAARRWRARQDAAAADVQSALHREMLDELCEAVCQHGGPASAEQLAGGSLAGRSPGSAWSLELTADMLREAVKDGLLRQQGADAFELTSRGAGRCRRSRSAYEEPVALEIDGCEMVWEGYESARAVARRAALQRWRATRLPGEADAPDDAWDR